MPRVQPRLALMFLATLALSACGDHDDRDRERDPERSEHREAGAFDTIELAGAARLEITVGQPASILVEGKQRAIDRVRTEVRGNTLYIETKPNTWVMTRGRPRVTLIVTMPKLASLNLEGGNDVHMRGFAGGSTEFRVAGATRLEADGHVDELTVHMAGAGHADLSRLPAGRAKVTVDGVGSVVVHPKETLDATMNGVGAILYTGSPRQVNTRMNGLGTIGQQRAEDEDESEHRHDDHEEVERAPVNPDDLQPEREDPSTKPASDSTPVI
jgi:hypothetical protein